jgi:hypothetical protein
MMRDLPANISAQYLRTGKRPRAFVSITEAGKFWGVAEHDGYLDRIAGVSEISRSLDPFGGMPSVAGCSLSVLTLGESFRLHTPLTLQPREEGSLNGAGAIYHPAASYIGARGLTYGSFSNASLDVGQRYFGGWYYTYRGFLQATIPSTVTSCEEGYIDLPVLAASVYASFNIFAVAGNWPLLHSGMFNDFDGWVYGLVPYTGAPITELYPAEEIPLEGTIRLRLNAAGRAAAVAAAGGVLRLMLLSSNDYAATPPTGDELVRFDVSRANATPSLTLHVNTLRSDNRAAEVFIAFADRDQTIPVSVNSTDMLQVWTGAVDRIANADGRTADLDLVAGNFRRNKLIPARTINTTDFASAPEASVGAPYPVTYGRTWPNGASGRHANGIGLEHIGGVLNPLSGLRDYFPCPVIDPGAGDYGSPMVVMTGSRDIYRETYGFPAVWDPGLKLFTRLWGTPVARDPEDTYTSLDILPKQRVKGSNPNDGDTAAVVYEQHLGQAVSIIPAQVYDFDGVVNPENCFDDGGGSAELTETNHLIVFAFPQVGSSGDIDKAELVFELDGDSVNYLTVSVYDRPEEVNVSGSNGETVHLGTGPDGETPEYVLFNSLGANFPYSGVAGGNMLIITDGPNRGRWPIHDVDDLDTLVLEYARFIVDEVSDYICPLAETTGQSYYILAVSDTPLLSVPYFRGAGQRVADVTTAISDWSLDRKLIKIGYTTANAPVNPFTISKVQLRLFYTPDDPIDTVWLDQVGPQDDGSGSITGTPNAIIENPAHMIAAVANMEGGLALTEIDIDSVAIAAAALSGWLFTWRPPEQTRLMDHYGAPGVLNSLGRQCNAAVFEDWRGRLKLRVFDPSDTFPHSGTNFPGALDIVVPGGDDDVESYDTLLHHPVAPGSFTLRQQGIDDVSNDFVLRYKLNHATGEYTETLYMTNGDGDVEDVEHNLTAGYLTGGRTVAELAAMCAASRELVQTTNTLTFEADAIRDEQTATRLLQRLIEWHTPRRREVGFTTWLNGLCWEEGDLVNIRLQPVYDLFGDALAERKKWRIIELATSIAPYRVRVRAIEVDAEVV